MNIIHYIVLSLKENGTDSMAFTPNVIVLVMSVAS